VAADAFLIEEFNHLSVPFPALCCANCTADQSARCRPFRTVDGSASSTACPDTGAPATNGARLSGRRTGVLVTENGCALRLVSQGWQGQEAKDQNSAHGQTVSAGRVNRKPLPDACLKEAPDPPSAHQRCVNFGWFAVEKREDDTPPPRLNAMGGAVVCEDM